jgi:hypothetical protein
LEQQLSVLNRIFTFVGGISLKEIPVRITANKRDYSAKMTEEEKKILIDFFNSTTKKVAKMLSWDCND